MAIKHNFTSLKPDSGDPTLVRPSNWNDGHLIETGSVTLDGLAADARGWEFLGSTELVANAPTTATVTIASREMLMVQFVVTGYAGNDIASFQFNGDTGNNYSSRFLYAASGGVAWTNQENLSTNRIGTGPIAIGLGRAGTLNINNILVRNKVIAMNVTEAGTNAATAAPRITLAQGMWFNTTAQITSLRMYDPTGINLLVGTGFAVWGKNMI